MIPVLCPNCFGDKYSSASGACPICGYNRYADDKVSDRSLQPGTILNGRYYVGRTIGAGGFGITYKAYDIKMNTLCCIKEYAPSDISVRKPGGNSIVLVSRDYEPPYLAGLRRFADEAEILAKLGTLATVVNITDHFRENDTAYFAMEYLDGSDLKALAKKNGGTLPADWVKEVIIQSALALDIVHTNTSIIHRDISPENIFITNDGRVKIVDFGSAKHTTNGVKEGASIVLKPGYAPPEQFSSTSVQGAFTDVYSLASTYYYCVTGEHIPTAPDRIAGMTYEPLKNKNAGVSPAVSDAIDHALQMAVKNRTQNMQTFIAELCADMPATGGQAQSQAAAAKVPRPHIIVKVAGTQPVRRDIPAGRIIRIGRSVEADLTISTDDLDVSRVHFEVQYVPETGVYYVRDRSTNGSFAGNMRLGRDVVYQVKPPVAFMIAKPAYIIELGVD